MRTSILASMIAISISSAFIAHAEAPEEIHLLMPYPEGKADSVLAVADPLVFISQGEFDALKHAAETAVPKPLRPPVIGAISSLVLAGTVAGEAADITADYTIDLLSDTLIYVPLVGQTTPVLRVTRDTKPLVLASGGAECTPQLSHVGGAGSYWGTILNGPGRAALRANLLVPVISSGDRQTLTLNIPPVGSSTFILRLPKGTWQAEATDVPLAVDDSGERSIVTLHPGRGGTISLSWWPKVKRVARPQDQAKTARIEAITENLLTLGEAAVKGVVDVQLRVWAGQAQLLKFAMPSDLEIMQVSGANIDTWEQEAGEVSVYLAGPVQGTERITLEYLITLPGPSGIVTVPSLLVGGAHRQNAFWAVVATTNIEVELEAQEGLEVLQPRELPQSLRQRASGRVLLAFRGDPETASAALRVSRHEDVAVLVAAIDQASLTTVAYESGECVTSCTYRVRNTTKQFLELELPQKAHLWHVRVDGQPVRPGMVNGRVLLPLASSVGRLQEQSFLVELTYMVRDRSPGFAGRLRLVGPAPDLPCSRVRWTLHYPEPMRPVRWEGNLEREHLRPTYAATKDIVSESEATTNGQDETRAKAAQRFRPTDSSRIVEAPARAGDEILRETDQEQSRPGLRQDLEKTEAAQRTIDYSRQLAQQQAWFPPRRSTGKPSVPVETPTVGRQMVFKQILQQGEAPAIGCWYVRRGVPWAYIGLVLLVVLLLALVALRRRAASFLLLVLIWWSPAGAVEHSVPREVVTMVPEKELSSLLLSSPSEEQSLVAYSRISSLIETLRTARRFFEEPSLAYLDNLMIRLDVMEKEATARGSASLVSFGQGWRGIEFLTSPARPGRVLLGGEPAPLWAWGQTTQLLVDGQGNRPLEIEYLVPVSSQGNSRTVTLPLPPASGVDFSIRLPAGSSGLQMGGKRVELSEQGNHLTAVLPLPGVRSIPLSWRFVPPELVLPSASHPLEEETAASRLLAEGMTLFSVDAGAVVGQTRLLVDIIQGYCDSLTFTLPSDVEVLEVSSVSLEDWMIRGGDQERSLLVYLTPRSRGRHVFDLAFETPLPDSLATVTLAEPALMKTVRFRGNAGIEVLSSLRVTAVKQFNASKTDPRDLPPEIWARAANPILLAYKFVEPGYRVSLRLEQQKDVPLLSASVDRENLLSVVSPTGRAVHRAELRLRNSGEQFLRISLPSSARIWTYLVDGKTFAPSRSDDGSYRLPVPASPEREGLLEPIMLELVWGEEVTVSSLGGRLRLVGPGLDIPCSVVQWELFLPKNRRWLPPRGNLKRDLHLPDIGLGVGDKKTREEAFDLLRQLSQEGLPTEMGGEGWETGAMPIQVDIPQEGKQVMLGRAMLLGEAPTVALWIAPSFPKIPVVVVSMFLTTLLWKFMREFRMTGFLVRSIITALLVVTCDPLAILGVPIGLLWRGLRQQKQKPAPYETP